MSSAPWVCKAGEDVLNVFDGEHDATYAQCVRRCAFRLSANRRRRAEPHQLEPAVAVWSAHHCDVDLDVDEPDDTIRPTSLDWRLALQLHAKFDKERSSSLEVIDHDAHVLHALDRHWCSPGVVGCACRSPPPGERSR
jgi:hypothetical protein